MVYVISRCIYSDYMIYIYSAWCMIHAWIAWICIKTNMLCMFISINWSRWEPPAWWYQHLRHHFFLRHKFLRPQKRSTQNIQKAMWFSSPQDSSGHRVRLALVSQLVEVVAELRQRDYQVVLISSGPKH